MKIYDSCNAPSKCRNKQMNERKKQMNKQKKEQTNKHRNKLMSCIQHEHVCVGTYPHPKMSLLLSVWGYYALLCGRNNGIFFPLLAPAPPMPSYLYHLFFLLQYFCFLLKFFIHILSIFLLSSWIDTVHMFSVFKKIF